MIIITRLFGLIGNKHVILGTPAESAYYLAQQNNNTQIGANSLIADTRDRNCTIHGHKDSFWDNSITAKLSKGLHAVPPCSKSHNIFAMEIRDVKSRDT